MLDDTLKTQLAGYLQRLTQPVEIVASLDARAASGEMRALLDEIERRRDRLGAFLPLGGADLAGVLGDVLRGLQLAQRFLDVTRDRVVVDLERLDGAGGIDHERAAQG